MQKFLPREVGGASRQHAFDGVGELVQRLRHALEHAHLSGAKAKRERPDQTSQAWVRRQDCEAGTCPLKLVQNACELRHVEKKKPVALKELASADFFDRAEKSIVLRQLIGQGGCRGVGQFRRRRVDDGEDPLRALRKRGLVCQLPLPPGEIG